VSEAAQAAQHVHRDPVGARIGMWLFLFTELILFAGLFLAYAVFRLRYAADFHYAAGELNVAVGTINTLILLTSSLTMVLAIAALERAQRRLCALFTSATILLGFVFLVNKYFEWSHKIHLGLYPNSPALAVKPPGEVVFYGLYYTMTGLHGLHVLAGMGVLTWMLVLILRHPRSRAFLAESHHIRLENAGLYWHLVDIIWIFLFPLFYLIS